MAKKKTGKIEPPEEWPEAPPETVEEWPDGDYEVNLPVGKGGVIHPQIGSMKPGQKMTIKMTGEAAQALQNGPNDFEVRKAHA